jgi:hypothetical protein
MTVAPNDHALAIMTFIPPTMPAMIMMSIPSVIITIIARAVVAVVTDADTKALGASYRRGR